MHRCAGDEELEVAGRAGRHINSRPIPLPGLSAAVAFASPPE